MTFTNSLRSLSVNYAFLKVTSYQITKSMAFSQSLVLSLMELDTVDHPNGNSLLDVSDKWSFALSCAGGKEALKARPLYSFDCLLSHSHPFFILGVSDSQVSVLA